MKRWTKKAAAALMAGSLVAASLTGCGSSADNSEIVSSVGEDQITYGLANFYARIQQSSIEYYYENMMGYAVGAEMWASEVSDGVTYEDSTKDSILTYLQDMYLIKQHAEEYGVSLTEEDLTAIDETIATFNEDNSLENLEIISGEEEYVKEYLELMTLAYKMEEPMKEGVNEEVSDEEAAQKSMKYVYFEYTTTDADGNEVDMTDEEKEALKASAEEFTESLKNDPASDIDTLAAASGLEVSTVTFDAETTSPNADLIAAADALAAAGDVTDMIESDYGIYVGVLTSLLDREATDAEKLEIVEERKEEQYQSLLDEWREAVEITVYDEVWAKLDLEDTGVTYADSTEE